MGLNSFDEAGAPSHCSEHPYAPSTTSFIMFRKEDVEQSVSTRFEQQVSRYPGHLAIKKRDHTVTYDALNRMANRIARTILSYSGETQQPVALLTKNDALTFAAILGILKAGKIYVPLDSSLSPTRAKFILEDTEAPILLASNENRSLAEVLISADRSLINIEDLGSGWPDENLGLKIPPTTLAHVLYTSGSTGEPKGVVDCHRNILHHVMRVTTLV